MFLKLIYIAIVMGLVGYLVADIYRRITIQREVREVIRKCEVLAREVEKKQLERTNNEHRETIY